jgi:hypothetical protein
MQAKKTGILPSAPVQVPLTSTSSLPDRSKPFVESAIPEYFLMGRSPSSDIPFCPYIVGMVKLHFVDAKNKIDTWQERVYMVKPGEKGKEISWDEAQDITPLKGKLLKNPPKEAYYAELPIALSQPPNYAAFGKSLAAYLYQSASLDIFSVPELKITSKLDETESGFQTRLTEALKEKRDDEVAKLQQKYQSKIEALNEKVRRAHEKLDKEQSQVTRKRFDTAISIGTTILGAILGRGKLSSSTVSKAGTSIKQAGRIGSAASAEENLKQCQQQLQDMQNELQAQMAALTLVDTSKIHVEKISVHPRKTDITVDAVGLVWVQSV